MSGSSSPFVHLVARIGCPVVCRAVDSIMHRHGVEYSACPRGPRSASGYIVPIHHHLIDLIRPTRRPSQLHRKAAYMRCLRCAGAPRASHERFRAFAAHSLLACRPLRPGEFDIRQRCRHKPSSSSDRRGTPDLPAIRFTQASISWLPGFAHLLRPASLLAPLTGSLPPSEAFYFHASNESVTLPVAGYTTTATGLLCW